MRAFVRQPAAKRSEWTLPRYVREKIPLIAAPTEPPREERPLRAALITAGIIGVPSLFLAHAVHWNLHEFCEIVKLLSLMPIFFVAFHVLPAVGACISAMLPVLIIGGAAVIVFCVFL